MIWYDKIKKIYEIVLEVTICKCEKDDKVEMLEIFDLVQENNKILLDEQIGNGGIKYGSLRSSF